MALLKALSIATLCALFVLISIGGYVSASGVGLTCPEWPLCPAGLVPMNEFLIEYFHRSKAAPRGMKIASIIAGSAVLGQITLGGFVIVERLHAILVTVHLGLGLVLFAMVLIVTLYSYGLLSLNHKKPSSIKNKVLEEIEEEEEKHTNVNIVNDSNR